jgi:hypothetical protein
MAVAAGSTTRSRLSQVLTGMSWIWRIFLLVRAQRPSSADIKPLRIECTDQYGYDKEDVVVMADRPGYLQPTKDNIVSRAFESSCGRLR